MYSNKWFTILVTLSLSLAGCATSNSKGRNPSAENIDRNAKQFKISQLAKLDGQKRGFYMVENTELHQFSVMECVSPTESADDVLQMGTTCTLLTDKWLGTSEDIRNNFDTAFERQAALESKNVTKKWSVKESIGNVAIGGMVTVVGIGAIVFTPMGRNFEGGEYLFRTFILLPAAAIVGVGVAAFLEYKDYASRRDSSIEKSLTKSNKIRDPKILRSVSDEVYEGIRRSLIIAMVAPLSS